MNPTLLRSIVTHASSARLVTIFVRTRTFSKLRKDVINIFSLAYNIVGYDWSVDTIKREVLVKQHMSIYCKMRQHRLAWYH